MTLSSLIKPPAPEPVKKENRQLRAPACQPVGEVFAT